MEEGQRRRCRYTATTEEEEINRSTQANGVTVFFQRCKRRKKWAIVTRQKTYKCCGWGAYEEQNNEYKTGGFACVRPHHFSMQRLVTVRLCIGQWSFAFHRYCYSNRSVTVGTAFAFAAQVDGSRRRGDNRLMSSVGVRECGW